MNAVALDLVQMVFERESTTLRTMSTRSDRRNRYYSIVNLSIWPVSSAALDVYVNPQDLDKNKDGMTFYSGCRSISVQNPHRGYGTPKIKFQQ